MRAGQSHTIAFMGLGPAKVLFVGTFRVKRL